ncbi:MAG: alpha-ribazole phosphatase family protein [Oscillibacter sp.]|nr:alpha-ribazole phosphatase family protein [Oscillibacter sp.]
MKITLIRHTSVAVEPGVVYGFTDVDTAPTFPEEAARVAQSIEGEVFDAVYHSPLSRCRKLAMACGFQNSVPDARLKEMNFGRWEMQRWEAIEAPVLEQWYHDWVNIPAGGGESFRAQLHRVVQFLDELKKQSFRHVCLFVHGGVVRCALIYAGQLAVENAFSVDIPYGSRTDIELKAEKDSSF